MHFTEIFPQRILKRLKNMLSTRLRQERQFSKSTETLKVEYDIPTEVAVLDGFNDLDRKGLEDFIAEKGLAMDIDDIAFVQEYFRNEKEILPLPK